MSLPLLEEALAGTSAASVVSVVSQCAERGAGIVRQVLTLASGMEGGHMHVQVSHLLSEVVKIMTETFPRSITVRSNVPGDLWPVNADATQLHQMLLNLCVNARDAISERGTLTLDAGNIEVDESYAAMNRDTKPGPYIVITVSDTGDGIPAEIMGKIFDPFFTTKETGKGSGLGLAAVRGIVKGHGGFLTVTSKRGAGSTFKAYLPAAPKALPEPAHTVQAPRGNGELILLVDDEACILAIAEDVLQTQGYRVLVAADGVDALSAFARHKNEIAAVITDIDMPFMDGIALTAALRKMSPALRVIVSTGDADMPELPGLNVNAILTKPYASATMLRALHTALSDPAPPGAAAV